MQVPRALSAHCQGACLSRTVWAVWDPVPETQAMTKIANNAEHGLWDPVDEVRIRRMDARRTAHGLARSRTASDSSTTTCWPIQMASPQEAHCAPLRGMGLGWDWEEPIKLRSIVGLIPLFAVEARAMAESTESEVQRSNGRFRRHVGRRQVLEPVRGPDTIALSPGARRSPRTC